ncbi:lipocalin-like domain-containing protein [Marinivivus vitaminiproducens]|uniref:lipocalin-like domain-containing protein n=1 Tax=Marinivivus vitaminiproducens TaxID=3035935 RepID=UPI003F9F8E17
MLASGMAAVTIADAALADGANQVVGTWRMVTAQIDPEGANRPAYGPEPHGWLVFTEELTFVEVMTDPRVPRFASDARGGGTDAEHRAAMAGSIGLFGRYTVDENGEFSGNRVEGSTFPNWVGAVRTRDDIQFTVDGDRMTETFTRPEGVDVRIVWERVS